MSRYHRVVRTNGNPQIPLNQGNSATIASPDQTPEEIDEQTENRSGSRSRKHLPKPLRFFPHLFPVPTTLYGILTILFGTSLIGLLIFQVRDILSPFLLATAIAVIFYPFRKEPKIRPLLLVTAIIFFCWLIGAAIGTILPFIIAFMIAYIVEPLVSYVAKRWFVRRWISALVLTMTLVMIVVLGIVLVTPVLVEQIGTALSSIDKVTASALQWAHNGGLRELTGIPQEKIDTMIKLHVMPKLAAMDGSMAQMAGTVGKSAPDIFNGVLHFMTVPFVMFYFVKDYWTVRGALYSFMPQEYQRRSQRFLRDMDDVVGGFLRGDLITSLFQGVFVGVGLFFIGVPGSLLLGVLTSFLTLIPFVGGYIAFALAGIAALGTPEPGITILWVLGLFIVQAIIESTVIGPQVMGRHTDLHPILVIVSLLIFGYFMGIPGMLVAIPVTSLLIRFATRWRNERRVKIEEEKLRADLEQNPHHAAKGSAQAQMIAAQT
ncbi:MAG: hypothetical protein JWQ98_1465 [Chlorobi bacterium]|nr:hypothetical protein [Chlorobiota bacterium]